MRCLRRRPRREQDIDPESVHRLRRQDTGQAVADNPHALLRGVADQAPQASDQHQSASAGSDAHGDAEPAAVKMIHIPVCYDKKVGLDLLELSSYLNTSTNDLIQLHCSNTYTVGAIGFAPGFPYLEGLDSLLSVSRRSEPRIRVPAGSVAIAAGYTGIYPSMLPGGWHIVGRTYVNLFETQENTGALLSVGDRVRFDPISIEELNLHQASKDHK